MIPIAIVSSSSSALLRAVFFFCLGVGTLAFGASESRRKFDIAAGRAEDTLRLFAQQASREIVFSPDVVQGVTTSAVRGDFEVMDGLRRLLQSTTLTALRDERTGALAIHRGQAASRKAAALAASSERGSPTGAAAASAGGSTAGSGAPGAIRGRVSNAQTGAYLGGAQVVVMGTNVSTLTERDGSFRLTEIGSGDVVLGVSYTGLNPDSARVSVPAGGEAAVEIQLTADVYKLEAFTVSELREGNALALTEQRNAMNVKNVVATDAFGNLRDGNIAELAVLLPGVVGAYVGNDIRTLQIRGFDSNLGSVTLDGSKLANGEIGRTDRNFWWDAISSDHIESVEVVKAPTPDMDADAIGGAINLKSKSAFNFSAERRIGLTAGAAYEPVRGTVMPNANVSYSDIVNARKTFGISVNFGYSRHNVPRDGTQIGYPTTTADPNYMNLLRLYDQENTRVRFSGGVKLDYKLRDNTALFFNTLVGAYNEQISGSSMVRRLLLQTNAASVAPGFNNDRVEWRNTANTTATLEEQNYPFNLDTLSFSAGARHYFNNWRIDYDGSHSSSVSRSNSIKHRRGAMSPILRNVGLVLDRSQTERYFPTVMQTSGADIYNLENYTAAPLNHRDWRGEDTIVNAAFNVERRFAGERPLTLKFGAKHRAQERTAWQRDRRYSYLGPDGGVNTGDEGLSRYREDRDYGLVEGRYRTPQWLSIKAISEAQAANPSWFSEDLAFHERSKLANDRKIQETIQSAYAMGTWRNGRLTLLGGLRFEQTTVEGETNLHHISPDETARRVAWVGPVTPEEAVRRARAEYESRIEREVDYSDVFPGLHARFELRPGLLLRASYSTSIGRPNFGSIIPDLDINDTSQVVSSNNIALKPQQGESFNVGIEYYFEPVGLISASVFHTRIDDFIFEATSIVPGGNDNGFDGQYAGYTLRTDANGGSAVIKGLELNYNQQLTFLPEALRGISVFANYTRLLTNGNYGGTTAAPTTQLADFVPTAANLGFAINRGKWEARVKGNYKGEWLTAFSANPGAVRYTESRASLDLNLVYRVTRNYSIFVDWVNIFNVFDPDYQYRDTNVRTYIPSGSRINVGVRARY